MLRIMHDFDDDVVVMIFFIYHNEIIVLPHMNKYLVYDKPL